MAWLDSWALVFMICGRPLFTLLITIPWCHLSPGAGESAPSPVTHLLPVSLAPPPHWWMTGSSRRQTVCALFLTHTGMFWAFTLSVFNHKVVLVQSLRVDLRKFIRTPVSLCRHFVFLDRLLVSLSLIGQWAVFQSSTWTRSRALWPGSKLVQSRFKARFSPSTWWIRLDL